MNDAASLEAHLQRLLHLWRTHGWDRRHGGFHSRLFTADLAPVPDGFKRLVVQTRQLHVFSEAARCGVPGAADVAHATFAYLCERLWDAEQGGWHYTLTPEGRPLDRRKDLYAHAFVLLSLASYAKLAPAAGALSRAEETFGLLKTRLTSPYGGYVEVASAAWEPEPGPRLQNPHMHLLEAALALQEVAPGDPWRALTRELLSLLSDRMFARTPGCLPERFAEGWKADATDPLGLEPGHHFEWVWLLERARRLGLDVPVDVGRALHAFATLHGVDDVHGGVVDRLAWSGAVLDARKRVWPQTEHLKALTTSFASVGLSADAGAEADAVAPIAGTSGAAGAPPVDRAPASVDTMLALCFARYVDARHDGWHEHAEATGAVFTDKMNATTVYHVWIALQEAIAWKRAATLRGSTSAAVAPAE